MPVRGPGACCVCSYPDFPCVISRGACGESGARGDGIQPHDINFITGTIVDSAMGLLFNFNEVLLKTG